jgi:hypothetical protein
MRRLSLLCGNVLLRLALAGLLAALIPAGILAQTQNSSAGTSACGPATASGSSSGTTQPTKGSNGQNQTVQQSAQSVENAAKQLGSIFGKKKQQQQAASAPPPCPPASTNANASTPPAAAPVAAGSSSQPSSTPAPAPVPPVSAGEPAADPALASWSTADPFVPDASTGGIPAAGSGVPGAPSAPPDFAKLPDIGGYLRVGLTIDQSKDALAKMHPGVKITYGIGSYDTIQPVSRDGNPPLAGLHGQFPNESVFFWYSQPPNRPQAAFSVGRGYQYPAPGIDRAKLVAALRQKYGPETKATRRYTTHEEPGDENITEMYWYYDEQGNFIASDKGSSTIGQPPFNCGTGSSWDPHSDVAWGGLLDAIRLNRLPAPGYCDTLVTLRIVLNGGAPGPVNSTSTSLDDSALIRRDALDAGSVAKAKAQQQQQQQLDQSKQAKPSL